MNSKYLAVFFITLMLCAFGHAQTTEFSYQGVLKSGGAAANGNFDFEFKLFDSVDTGTQQGSTVQRLNVAVANGIYAVSLDFGAAALPGADRFIDISIRTAGGGAFTSLTPRQKITSAPYAIKSANAASADSVSISCTGCVTAAQIGSLPAGSGNYIQNQNAGTQASSNFNISGNGIVGGRVGIGTASPQGSLHIVGVQPPSTTVDGTNAASALGVFAGKGGNTSGMTGQVGGRGGDLLLQAGDGGNATNGGMAQGGDGGFIVLQPGVGGTGPTSGENGIVLVVGRLSALAYDLDDSPFLFGDENNNNTFLGFGTQQSITSGTENTFVGSAAGQDNTGGSRNTFLGKFAGLANVSGNNNTTLGSEANVGSGSLSFATAIGSGAIVSTSNTILLGRGGGADSVSVPGELTTGTLVIQNVGGIPGINSLCVTATNLVKICSSSLRYKSNVKAFGPGLSLVKQLQPISYDWKDGGMKDVGFGAEDVAKIDQRFVTYNAKGEVEGVKYDRLSVAFVNAFKEQQAEINSQKSVTSELQRKIEALNLKIEHQDGQMAELKKIVCSLKPEGEVCR